MTARVWNKRDPDRPMDAVYVGRGTPWGNPFKMFGEADRDVVCDLFEAQVLPGLDVTPLIGRDLVCWCAPKRCHADALLRAASAIEARQGGNEVPSQSDESATRQGDAQ